MTRMHAMTAMSMVAVAMLPLTVRAAQQAGHQMPGMGPPAQAAIAACAQAQPQAMQTLDAANMRLEAARQSNSPSAMRAAMDDLQGAIRSLRAQLAACRELQSMAPTDPQAGHTMPGMPPSPATPGTPGMQPASPAPAPGAPMDHSKMPMGAAPGTKPAPSPGVKPPTAAAPMDHAKMPTAAATKSPSATGAKPAAPSRAKPPAAGAPMDHSKMPMGSGAATQSAPAKGATPAAAAAPMDHSKMGMGTSDPAASAQATDPVCGLKVDPATAPQATHGRQTYHFCSETHRQLFQKNPTKYLPKGQ